MVGTTELIAIILVALLLFGAGRISDIGKGLGEGIRNFKKGLRDEDEEAAKQLPAKPDVKEDDTHKPA
jgi:sec-independent protein translocase protein TatA